MNHEIMALAEVKILNGLSHPSALNVFERAEHVAHASGGGAEREGDRESGTGSVPTASNCGLKLTNCKIMT